MTANSLLPDGPPGTPAAAPPPIVHVELTARVLDLSVTSAHLEASEAGGVVVFAGRVRDHHHGRRVLSVEYEAYEEMALPVLKALAAELTRSFPVTNVVLIHRTGHLQVGEISVLVAVASPHRDEAFRACRQGIDRIKQDLPVWKKEHFADGTTDWVG